MTTRIYEPLNVDGYECVNACDPRDYEVFHGLDGSPRAKDWRPIRVRRMRPDDLQTFKPSDFPWLDSHALVMRRTAIAALGDILETHGEVLPLATDDDIELFVFNVRTVDALDEERSSIMRFPDTNRIMWIKKAIFIPSKIRDLDLFALPHRGTSTYVSDRFVSRVESSGLRGLTFTLVSTID